MNNFGFILATKMLMDGKRKVRYMYREEVSNPQDSGWRFFCGDESQAYVDNADNIGIYDINTLLEIDASIAPYLNSAANIAFEREDENGPFIVSDGFAPDREED